MSSVFDKFRDTVASRIGEIGPKQPTTARQRISYAPVQEEEEPWFRGSTPTLGETMARAYSISNGDESQARNLFDTITRISADPAAPIYSPYSGVTNPAVGKLSDLGIDVSGGINSDWIAQNAHLKGEYRLGTSGTPLAPSSSSTQGNDAAYWYYQVLEAEDTTARAEAEWEALREELTYWAGRTDRNYSDQEILDRINWADYPTLTKMDEGRKQGTPVYLNRAVGYSEDAVYGTLWAARNGGGTGNSMADAMSYYMGRGDAWAEDKAISERLDPTSDKYCPYALGSTMDDAALYFGVSSFSPEWLEENRGLLAGNDATAQKMYAKVYEAEQRTLAAEQELETLQGEIERLVSYSVDPARIMSIIDWKDYPTLAKMDESLRSGEILQMTRAVPYSSSDLQAQIQAACDAKAEATKAANAWAEEIVATLTPAAPTIPQESEIVQQTTQEAPPAGTTAPESEQEVPLAGATDLSPVSSAAPEATPVTTPTDGHFARVSAGDVAASLDTAQKADAAIYGTPVSDAAKTEENGTDTAVQLVQQERLSAAGVEIAQHGTAAEQRVWQAVPQASKISGTLSFAMQRKKTMLREVLPHTQVKLHLELLQDPVTYMRNWQIISEYETQMEQAEEQQALVAKHNATLAELSPENRPDLYDATGAPLAYSPRDIASSSAEIGDNVVSVIVRYDEQSDAYQVSEVYVNRKPVSVDELTEYGGEAFAAQLEQEMNGTLDTMRDRKRLNEAVKAIADGTTKFTELRQPLYDQEAAYQEAKAYCTRYSLPAVLCELAKESGEDVPAQSLQAMLQFVSGYGDYVTPEETPWSIFELYEMSGTPFEEVADYARLCDKAWEQEIADIDYCLELAEKLGISDKLGDGIANDTAVSVTFGGQAKALKVGRFTDSLKNSIPEIADGTDTPDYIAGLLARKEYLIRQRQDAYYFLLRDSEGFKAYAAAPIDKYGYLVESTGEEDQLTRATRGSWYDMGLRTTGHPDYDGRVTADNAFDVDGQIHTISYGENLMYEYLKGQYGYKVASDYSEYRKTRQHLRVQGMQYDMAKAYAEAHPFAASVQSIVAQPFGGIFGTAYVLGSTISGTPVDPYHRAFDLGEISSTERSTSRARYVDMASGRDSLTGQLIGAAYDIVTTLADSGFNAALFRGAAPFVMGLPSFSGTYQDVLLRGGSEGQALQMASVAYGAETLTEMVFQHDMMEAFQAGTIHSKADFLKHLALSSGAEGLGEGVAQFATIANDYGIMGEKSNFNANVKAYEQQKFSPEEAKKMAFRDALLEIGYATMLGTAASLPGNVVSYAAGSLAGGKPNPPSLPDSITVNRLLVLSEAERSGNSSAQIIAAAAVLGSEDAVTVEDSVPAQATPASEKQETGRTEPHNEPPVAAPHLSEGDIRQEMHLWAAEKLAEVAGGEGKSLQALQAITLACDGHSDLFATVAEQIRTTLLNPDSEAHKALAEMVQEPSRITPKTLEGFAAVAAEEFASIPDQQERMSRIVTERLTARRVQQKVADGAMDGLASYQAAVDKAAAEVQRVEKNLQVAREQLTATSQNMATLSEQHLNDPLNQMTRGAFQQAIKDFEGDTIVVQQAEESLRQREADYDAAVWAHENQAKQMMTTIRQEAAAEVAAEIQQAEEERAAREAEAVVQAEEQRLNENIAIMEAESFIEENGYSDADETSLDEVRQEIVGTAPRVTIDRATAEFASKVSRRFQVPIRFVNESAFEGAYDQRNGGVIIGQNATQSDVIRKVFAHELTHRTESSSHYAELRDALLQLRYGDDAAARQADLDAIRAQYAGVYTKEQDFESELVAYAAEELIGNEDSMARLVADKPSVARRVWEALKNFVNKLRGVKDPMADTLRRAENLMRKALDDVARRETENLQQVGVDSSDGLKYKLKANPETDAAEQYSYDHLTSQPDMAVTQMPDLQSYRKGNGADRAKAKSDGIRDADSMKSSSSSENKLFVDNVYTGTPLQINTTAIQHSIAGSSERQLRNAAAGAVIGRLAANAIPVNELIHQKTDTQPWVNNEYLYLSLAEDGSSYYPVALVVQATEEDLGTVTHIEALEGIEKRYVYSVNAHQHKKGAGYEDMTANSSSTSADSTVSIANLLDLVKDDFADGFSADVLQHLGLSRPAGPYSNVKYSLPSPALRSAQINAWRNSSANAQAGQTVNNLGVRQFAGQTAQNSQAIPDWLKRTLWGDRFYERDTNRDQAERAYTRMAEEGFEAAHNRLMQEERWNANDNVEALILLHMSLRPAEQGGWGNPAAAMEIAHRFNTEGTAQGQALQARKLFSRMTPVGMRMWVSGHAESALINYLDGHRPIANKVKRLTAAVEEDVSGLDATDPFAPGEDGSVTINPKDVQRWGIPVNEQQQALIDQYRLGKVTRPGIHYNKATLKQRMLEAILATPDATAPTGNGMSLIERLELMQAGAPVITEADLAYITQRMLEFSSASQEDQDGRLGDLALARAYEAYGNISPATLREKSRTWRYTSMLLSVPSAARNVIGNAAQGMANAVSHDVAVLLDKAVSTVTHERTMALNTMQERADGWRAFVEETANTYRDYFVDRATTRHGNDRYDTHQRGRVFQSALTEGMRTLEGFLMSVGDRNVWRKTFVQSMAEQQRIADLNGATFNSEQAIQLATQDANYATFSEDNAVRSVLNQLKGVPVVGDVLDYVMPFTGVPTNIIRRMGQYSPFGLAWNVARTIGRAWTGKSFDQRAFVNGVARGLTGTAMYAAGMLLYSLGAIRLGTGEEDDDKVYGLQTARGEQYTPYIKIGNQYVNLSVLAPFISPVIMGATAYKLLEEDENAAEAALNAAIAAGDQIFDASYMANLSDIFGGYGSVTENLLTTMGSSAISQNIPSILSQWASAMDPYVRETRDKNKLVEIVNKGLVNKLPWLREQLPAKIDVAGRPTVNTDQGIAAFIDPFNRTLSDDDPALAELNRLYETLGTSAFLPSDALSGRRNTISGVASTIDGTDKEAYKRRYGELWLNGGRTYDSDGNRVTIMGVTQMIQQPWYQAMTDAEKAEAIQGTVAAAKAGAVFETGEMLGHTPKSTSSAASSYTKKATRPMQERFANSDSPYIQQLSTLYAETGDGAFIPKGISGSFTRGGTPYNLTGEDLDILWDLYELYLEKRLGKIDWSESPEDLAAAVESAYSNAAADAKDQYVKQYGK